MDFDQIIDRRQTDSAKWRLYPQDVLPMWLADMDFKAPQPVIQALHERVEHGIFGYGSLPDGLKEAIFQHLVHFFDWSVDTEDINFVCGVVTGFVHAIYSLTEPGDRVLIQTPIYPPILRAPLATGRQPVHNPLILQDNGKYEIDFDDFEAKVASGVKLFILCNPHNPVGRVFTREELTKMAEICLKYNVFICSDEIHSDLVYSGKKHVPIASLSPEIAQACVTYFAPSKTFNIAGLTTSVAVAENPTIKDKLCQTFSMLLGHPNILGLHAARAAYLEGRPWLEQVMAYLEENRDFLAEYVNKYLPCIYMWAPEGTFLGWLDCRQMDVESPHTFFLEKAKVGFNDGISFGEDGKDFLRINFGCPRSTLEEGLSRMKTALERR
jgi:cystathionine beta-lyase